MNKLPIQYSEKFGVGGKPVIFLHGLLGSSRNWRSVAKHLEKEFQVHCLDLRNHGNSFHHQDSSILAMAQDLHAYICENKLESVILCGHSLGGKVAMRFACDYPSLLSGLAIVDIAPRDYPPEHHVPTLEALLSLDLHSIDSRKNADEMLSQKDPKLGFSTIFAHQFSSGRKFIYLETKFTKITGFHFRTFFKSLNPRK